MQKYTNVSDVPLSLAVFLASDFYDYSKDQHTVSATALIKPLRQIILGGRVPQGDSLQDLRQMVASRMGSSIHDGIERAWKINYREAMKSLGFPKKVIDRVQVNPTKEELSEGGIAVYLEQRASKVVGKYTISGKYDFIGDGRVEDFKSTSTFTAMKGSNDDKYILQGSIYRWLQPDIITKSEMAIQFLFTDWQARMARTDANYPQHRFLQKVYPLLSIPETDAWVRRKLSLVDQYIDAKEEDIPLCEDADLWRSDPSWKYYKNPAKMSRSTKNFDNAREAMTRLAEDANVGVVVEVPGQVMACKYCAAFSLCSQKDALVASGELIL